MMKNYYKIIFFLFIGCTMWCCSPKFTEAEARLKFGCKTDSLHIDSNTTHAADSGKKYTERAKDTVYIKSPCEEIAKMSPGEKKTVRGKRTTSEYGKDSSGKSFFKCEADAYRDSMEWYRDSWKTTVTKTIFQSNPPIDNHKYAWWELVPWWIGLTTLILSIGFLVAKIK